MNDSLQSLDQFTATAIDLTLRFAPKVLVAVLILVAGFYAGRWAGRALGRALERAELDPPVCSLLGRVAEVLVLGLFAIMALQNLGVELLPLIAGLGIAGAGIALAMQGVLGNMVAGLTILVSRPFRVGDYISIAKEEGLVQDISLFSTTLEHTDLSRVVIPNRKIVGEVLHNYNRIRQLGIEVVVSYQTDVAAAAEAIRRILRANPRVLPDPAPGVGVARLAESGVLISVAPWVSVPDYGAACAEINQAILEALRAPLPSTSAYLAGEGAKDRFAGRDAA